MAFVGLSALAAIATILSIAAVFSVWAVAARGEGLREAGFAGMAAIFCWATFLAAAKQLWRVRGDRQTDDAV